MQLNSERIAVETGPEDDLVFNTFGFWLNFWCCTFGFFLLYRVLDRLNALFSLFDVEC